MADYPSVVFPTGGYQSPQHKGWNLYGHSTPNFEIMEGMRFGQFHPAPYLPTIRLERQFQDWIVISAGKPVALDSNGWLVPAGFKKLLAMGAGHGPQYSQIDINFGIRNAEGNVPSVGDYVVNSMIAAGLTVGHVAGVCSYDVYLLAGSDPSNPATFRFHNYKRQDGVAVLTDYLLEYPVQPLKRSDGTVTATVGSPVASPYVVNLSSATVLSWTVAVTVNGRPISPDQITMNNNAGPGGVDQIQFSTAERAKLAAGDTVVVTYKYEESFYQSLWNEMAVWRGPAVAGAKVTVDEASNFIMYTPVAVGDTSAGNESANILSAIDATLDIVGQITLVDAHFPKQYLDRVKTAFDPRLTGRLVDGMTGLEMNLDRMPGSATDGMPGNIYFAGGDKTTGIVRFNLNIT